MKMIGPALEDIFNPKFVTAPRELSESVIVDNPFKVPEIETIG
jgi:hypothetical protein